jgi:site-specific DNA recombinase
MPKAALYLRSSKDRSDVSIDAQRRDLERLAAAKGLTIVREFADAVESGKSEMRPGFQALLRDLKSAGRTWTHLLLLDTSRLGRRQWIVQAFDYHCERRGIKVLYSKLPESDPTTDMMIKGVLRVFDEFHSLMSREKGLAGMAENVRQGWRAGGRPPRGYRLQQHETGAVRDGEPVRKTKLTPSPEADIVARYLKARAEGRSRGLVAKALGITWSALVDMEWNALTYAGHTVWNMRRAHDQGQGFVGGGKRRPRSEWLIQRDTHEPLITDSEALILLAQLEGSPHARTRRGAGTRLLAGLLRTPAGTPWQGDGRDRYRVTLAGGGARTFAAGPVEAAVLQQVASDMQSQDFIDSLVRSARDRDRVPGDSLKPLRDQIQAMARKISRMIDMAAELQERAPALRRIEELERERETMEAELQRREAERAEAVSLQQLTAADVTSILGRVAFRPDADHFTIRESLNQIVDRIDLDPESGDCRLHYRISPAIRANLASPWGFEPQLQP